MLKARMIAIAPEDSSQLLQQTTDRKSDAQQA